MNQLGKYKHNSKGKHINLKDGFKLSWKLNETITIKNREIWVSNDGKMIKRLLGKTY